MTGSADAVEVTPSVLKSMPLPEPGSDKGARGHVLVVAGTSSTPGAAALAAEAALRAGAGKLTVMTCAATAPALAVALPEAKVDALSTTSSGHPDPGAADDVLAAAADADAVLVGCGFFDAGATLSFLRQVLPRIESPLVLDATASVYVREEASGLHHLEGRSILTVNPTELALTDGDDDGGPPSDPEVAAGRVAQRSRAVVLCGGPTKHLVSPDHRRWVFSGGGPSLAVSGSGDVQAGIATGLLARCADPARAAVWGAYLHGRAGERLAAEIGPVGSLAREQARQVPLILREIH
jgi:hydroxyethylthiazole kinase-like uncharacterized protein yjeF